MRFSKEIEQALHSISYLKAVNEMVSARELSDSLNISFEKLSKIMQKLAAAGIVKAIRGRQGGYILNCSLDEISLFDLHRILDDSRRIVPCLDGKDCYKITSCVLLPAVNRFQNELDELLSRYSLADFTGNEIVLHRDKEVVHD